MGLAIACAGKLIGWQKQADAYTLHTVPPIAENDKRPSSTWLPMHGDATLTNWSYPI